MSRMSFDVRFQMVEYFNTGLQYAVVFDDDGSVDSILTEEMKYNMLFEYICFGLMDFVKFRELCMTSDDEVLGFIESMDKTFGVTFESVEYIAEQLKNLGLLKTQNFKFYLELKELFCSVGLSKNIEIPLIFVSRLSRRGRFGRVNDKLVSKKFLKLLKALNGKLKDREFKEVLYSYERLAAEIQMLNDGGK